MDGSQLSCGREWVCPIHGVGYGKMKMGHIGSPHCTLAHILVLPHVCDIYR